MQSEHEKLRVVIDTNVYISGLNFSGKPGEILELFMTGETEVYVSAFILSELINVFKNRFEWDNEQIVNYLRVNS